jgi:hypothetical protein
LGALFSPNPLYECHWNYSLSHQVVRRILFYFLKQKKGEFWTFVPNVNLTNCSKFFDIKKIKLMFFKKSPFHKPNSLYVWNGGFFKGWQSEMT